MSYQPRSTNPYIMEKKLNSLNDNLSGFKFYPIGTQLVALVADDSFYTDVNGKYVLADSPTGQILLADTATYKALASTEDCRGEVGADTATPFKSDTTVDLLYEQTTKNRTTRNITLNKKMSDYYALAIATVHDNEGYAPTIGHFPTNLCLIENFSSVSLAYTNYTMNLTYVNDSTLSLSYSNGGAKFRIYGIK